MDASKATYQDNLKEQVCYLTLTKNIFSTNKNFGNPVEISNLQEVM